ncbi:hypothetical protein KJ742_06270 [Patescibacteria group bacterium]|nr:hypothetical protein [Patescibacteria group bacterium]MBU1683516.1 hypothetical protein [Patescibacteria group bacterium]MBU1935390.1 hypothetical protein [Patescibacteria group bacterium]
MSPEVKGGKLSPQELETLEAAKTILDRIGMNSGSIESALSAAKALAAHETRGQVASVTAPSAPAETPSDSMMDAYFDMDASFFDSLPDDMKDYQKSNALFEKLKQMYSEYLAACGGVASEAVFDRIREMFANYQAAFSGKTDFIDDPELDVKHKQLKALMRHPDFMKDDRAVGVIELTADYGVRDVIAPWGFEMYLKDDMGYELADGFGVEQVGVFSSLAQSDKLWASRNPDLKRVLMASIGEALKYTAKKHPEALIDTIKPRVHIMEKNNEQGRERDDDVQEKTSFGQDEIAIIKNVGKATNYEGIDTKVFRVEYRQAY